MYQPSLSEFLKLTKKGNLIPVCREILADLETPVSAYLKIAKKARHSFLLESVTGQEKVARFSFLAKDPGLVFQSKGESVKIISFRNGRPQTKLLRGIEKPLGYIRGIMQDFRFVDYPGLPRFCGGLVGYLSYDCVRFFEKLPKKTKDDLKLPDIFLVMTKSLIVFDHLSHKIKIFNYVHIPPKASRTECVKEYTKTLKEIDKITQELKRPLITEKKKPKTFILPKLKSNFTKIQFQNIIKKAKKEIRAGEIIQVVLSQRFETRLRTDPFNVYRQLRVINPSPYMFYLNFDDIKIAGSSPELLVRCEDSLVETRPIAGTRRRGRDEREDEFLAKDLLSDQKEKAEHIMLVDLGRNDLGRVCAKGSVKVSEFMAIEKYSHVMHIISNVCGKIHPHKDSFDALTAAFPAGTVSGAPKIRAMEIIENLEKISRGPYAGCVGYFSFSGNLDTCITIRTIVIKGNKAYIQAGAGIVADSIAGKEYQETLNKAKAQLMAIELAHKNF